MLVGLVRSVLITALSQVGLPALCLVARYRAPVLPALSRLES